MVPKSDNYQELEELTGFPRDKRLRKRRYPRRRDYAVEKKKELEIARSRDIEVENAEEKIAKHLVKFFDLDSDEGRRQAERYLEWVIDSLTQGQLITRDDDLEFKTAVASVKAGGQQRQKTRSSVRVTHLPTLISVRNEEERSLEQNKEAAYENLVSRLTTHLSLWQILAQKKSDTYSIGEISRQRISLIKSLLTK